MERKSNQFEASSNKVKIERSNNAINAKIKLKQMNKVETSTEKKLNELKKISAFNTH
jgi:hypothetical protein